VNKTRLNNKNNEQTRVGGGLCIGIRADLTYEDKTHIFKSHENVELICTRIIT
jgi:hypothetical protein